MRLLLGAAVAILAALTAAWLTMTLLFQRHIERRVKEELTPIALHIVANLSLSANGTLALEEEPADSRFDEPASGLYWQVSTPATALRSRSLWDQSLTHPTPVSATQWKLRKGVGPFEPHVLTLARTVKPDSKGPDVLVQVSYDQASLISARDDFGRELGLFLAALWVLLSAGTWLQVSLGLRPLKRVGTELEEMRKHSDHRLTAAHPSEVQPLADAINALAAAREQDLQWARRRAADLAHGLKTPLSALSAQSRRAREAGADEAADGLDRAIAAATTAVETELARSRAAATRRTPAGTETAPQPVVESVVGVIERTDAGAQLVFAIELPPELRVPMLAEDLTELLGALIENASRFAHRQVRITGSVDETATISIEDDGPGIGAERTEQALMRGGRLDEAGSGHGLGLAIAHDLVEATGGTLTLLRSALGGLHVSVAWPRS